MDCESRRSSGLSRRAVLRSGAFFAAWSALPVLPSLAGGRDPRLLVVILRGALDGLATVMPTGDPSFDRWRADFFEDTRRAGAPVKLDSLFSLTPSMPRLASLYAANEALMVHAAATPYRARSHFDGQDVLESGLPGVARADSGWLNRVIELLPQSDRVRPQEGLALGYRIPLVLQGSAPVLSWAPPALPDANSDTVRRLLDLYDSSAPRLAEALRKGVRLDDELADVAGAAAGSAANRSGATMMGGGRRRNAGEARKVARAAAQLMAKDDGPRVAALSLDGWDTHANERPGTGRLGRLLQRLDAVFGDVADGMKPVWKDTVVVAVTEFGRTVAVNGTQGTDHGTGTCAFLLGGSVRGGRVIADWPGLGDRDLLDGRDLAPTIDLRAVLKGVLRDHVGVTPKALATSVFPKSASVRPMAGLVG